MQTGKLMTSTFSAWGLGAVYDFINRTTGHDIRVLLYAGVAVLLIGLYIGLYANSNKTQNEET